jgi:hypothetical protein
MNKLTKMSNRVSAFSLPTARQVVEQLMHSYIDLVTNPSGPPGCSFLSFSLQLIKCVLQYEP